MPSREDLRKLLQENQRYVFTLIHKFSIDPKLAPVHKSRIDGKIFVQGAKWAEVSESEVKNKLRKFYEKPSMPQQWANELAVIVKDKYSIDSIKSQLDNVLVEFKC